MKKIEQLKCNSITVFNQNAEIDKLTRKIRIMKNDITTLLKIIFSEKKISNAEKEYFFENYKNEIIEAANLINLEKIINSEKEVQDEC